MFNFDLEKLDSLVANDKRASKYDFLYKEVNTTKKILDTLKRGVRLDLIIEELNKQIEQEEKKLIAISLKQHLVSIVKSNETYKDEYSNIFKVRKVAKKKETKDNKKNKENI